MNNTTLDTTKLEHDTVAFCAYMLWDNEGRPAGRDKEHWLKAEAYLRETLARNGKNHHSAVVRENPAPVETKPVNRILSPVSADRSPAVPATKPRRKTIRKR